MKSRKQMRRSKQRMRTGGIVALVTGVVAALLIAPLATAASASQYPPPVEDCTPSAAVAAWTEVIVDEEAYDEQVLVTPAVEEVSHTDYWYMPVKGEVGRWSHSDKGAFDTYDWTLYYRTGTTQVHVEVEAADAVYATVNHAAVTHDVEHPEIPAVVCEPTPYENEVTPVAPTWVDECGVGNAHWVLADETPGYKYKTWNIGSYQWVLILPDHGNYFPKGTKVLFKAKETNVENCEVPVPVQYSLEPTAAACGVAGTLADPRGLFDHVTITISPAYDGPGGYLISADTEAGYEFPDGTTHKERFVNVPGAIAYQGDDPEAPCFQASGIPTTPVLTSTPPTCTTTGTVNAEISSEYTWQIVDNGNGTTTYTAIPNEGFVIAEGAQSVFIVPIAKLTEGCGTTPTPSPSPTPGGPPLAETGGGIPWGPIGSGVVLLLTGLSAVFWRRYQISRG